MLASDETVSFVVPKRSGGYLVGLGRTVAHLDWDSGKTTVLKEAPLMGTKNRFNDAKCDISGRLWAGMKLGFILSFLNPLMVLLYFSF